MVSQESGGLTLIDYRPRVIVAGTRTFDNPGLLGRKLDALTAKLTNPIILTGAGVHAVVVKGRRVLVGADHFAEQWAYSRRLTVMRFHADWSKHGKNAGPIRNKEMVLAACERRPAYCCVFWDGSSPGTANVIELCRANGVKLVVVRYND